MRGWLRVGDGQQFRMDDRITRPCQVGLDPVFQQKMGQGPSEFRPRHIQPIGFRRFDGPRRVSQHAGKFPEDRVALDGLSRNQKLAWDQQFLELPQFGNQTDTGFQTQKPQRVVNEGRDGMTGAARDENDARQIAEHGGGCP